MGHVTMLRVQSIISAPSDANVRRSMVFNADNQLFALTSRVGTTITNSTTSVVTRSGDLLPDLTRMLLPRATQNSPCSYTSIAFDGSRESLYTRRKDYQNDNTTLPSNLFIQYNQSYRATFTIKLDPRDVALGNNKFLGLQIFGSGIKVRTALIDTVDPLELKYSLTIADEPLVGELPTQSVAGRDLNASLVRFTMKNASWGCQANGGDNLSINVYKGCPPFVSISFDDVASRHRLDTCAGSGKEEGVICASFIMEWSPTVEVLDHVSGERSKYMGRYKFEIVGGGPTKDTIEPYNADDIAAFNQGDKAIWALDVIADTLGPDSKLAWVCGAGSPCGAVFPKFPNTPDYYFKVKITSKGSVSDSYCDRQTEFILRLHGLDLDITTKVMIAGITVSVFGFMLVLAYLYFRKSYKYYKRRIQNLYEDHLLLEASVRTASDVDFSLNSNTRESASMETVSRPAMSQEPKWG